MCSSAHSKDVDSRWEPHCQCCKKLKRACARMFVTHRASTPAGWTTLKHHTAVWSKWRPLYGGKGVKNATRSGTKPSWAFSHHPQLKHYRAAIRDRGDKFLCVNAVESQWVTNMARKGEHAQLWSRLISPGWSIQDLPKFTQVYAAGILRVCHLRSTYICRRHLCTTLKSTPAKKKRSLRP